MKLVLFSGGDPTDNLELDEKLLQLTEKKRPKMTYIPSSVDEHPSYFAEWREYYRSLGIKKFKFFPLKKKLRSSDLKLAFSSDIIYLSGGNTFEFLRDLRHSGLKPLFRKFVEDGGVLAGISAGAILMTPSIAMAAIPSSDRDENNVMITNWNSMKLVNFEFSPHYEKTLKTDRELKLYSKLRSHPIYSCPDGSGLIVRGDQIQFHGPVYKFYQGRKEEILP